MTLTLLAARPRRATPAIHGEAAPGRHSEAAPGRQSQAALGRHRAILAYLREMRHDRGLSMAELAWRVGASPVTLAGVLWGEPHRDADVLLKLADALEIDPQLVAPLVRESWLGLAPARAEDEPAAPQSALNAGWPTVVAREGSD